MTDFSKKNDETSEKVVVAAKIVSFRYGKSASSSKTEHVKMNQAISVSILFLSLGPIKPNPIFLHVPIQVPYLGNIFPYPLGWQFSLPPTSSHKNHNHHLLEHFF